MPRILAVGEAAITVEFGEEIAPEINATVIALAQAIDRDPIDGVFETVPTYRSLLVRYDPSTIRGVVLEDQILERIAQLDLDEQKENTWRVPAVYGGEVGLDLEDLARSKDLTPDALIDLHAGCPYRVYMIGFAPGFAYLGGLDPVLHTPRLAVPRQHVAAGAIGIGGQQASINSVAGPSGWRYIAWTPLHVFDPNRDPAFLLSAGDIVKFEPIDARRGLEIAADIAAGNYSIEVQDES